MTNDKLLQQPTYALLDSDFEGIKQKLIDLIQTSSKQEIMQGAFAQAQKGLKKYGRTIDQNPNFDPKGYLMEEIFDAFVYMANLEISLQKNKE
jgi:hypothetical protein